MSNLESFLVDYTLIIFISIIILVSMIVNWLFSKNTINNKVGTKKRCQLSNKDYKIYCKNSEKSIINTTISFDANLCDNENEIDDLYSKTIIVGKKLLRDEGFRISVVKKV